MKLLQKLISKRTKKIKPPVQPQSKLPQQSQTFYSCLSKNVKVIQNALGHSSDLVIRQFEIGKNATKCALIYIDGLINVDHIQNDILKPLIRSCNEITKKEGLSNVDFIQFLQNRVLTIRETHEISDFAMLYSFLLNGETGILVDGQKQALAACTRGWKDRGVQEPTTQSVVKGPQESFTETLQTNTSLIRRKIKDIHLRIETLPIGNVTKTDVAIVYIKGIADEAVIQEIYKRLHQIELDGILEGGYLEELMQDKGYTPFPTVYYSERPDEIATGILEGRIAIMVDGTPFVLLVPALFVHFFHSSEDYYQRFDLSSLVRILRFFSFFAALLVPSIYIAVTTFHQEMIPTSLLISLGAQREGVPFPALLEAMMMEIIFEILREAGIRMPKAIGSAISIVGALVLGEAAVQAGLISAAMVIVVSITAISSFIFPAYNMSFPVRILRFVFMIFAGFLGLFGIGLGLFILVLHLSSLRSFGVPYMAPFGPFMPQDYKDTIFRFPHWGLFFRPRLISKQNPIRQTKKAMLGVERRDPDEAEIDGNS